MQERPITRYLHLGAVVQYLKSALPLMKVGTTTKFIKRLVDYLEEFGLPVTWRASFDLQGFAEKLKEEVLEHHFRLIGRPAEIQGIGILAKLIGEGEIDHFIQELEEVSPGDYPTIDMVAVEGKLG